MEDCLVDDHTALEVLNHNPLQQLGGYMVVPHAFRVHRHDGPAPAHSQARRL